MTYLVSVEVDACAAHGDCADLAPEVFEVEDVARIVGTGPDDLVFAAAELCPTTAIRIVDQQTGEQVFP
jgi:ferredoxin